MAGPTGLRLGEHADGRADLAGSAVAALEAVALDEGGLQRVQRARRAQAFDRHDLVALVHDGERQARVDAPAVDQHGAGAALPVVAALLGAGQVQMLAQRVEQRRPRVQLEGRTRPLTVRAIRAFFIAVVAFSRSTTIPLIANSVSCPARSRRLRHLRHASGPRVRLLQSAWRFSRNKLSGKLDEVHSLEISKG